MYQLDTARARKILLEQRYNPAQVERLLKNYPPLPESLGTLVEQWFETQEVPDILIEGISLQEAMKLRHSHFLVTVRDMRKLLDPTLPQEKRDLWRRILTTPVHYA